MDFIDIGTTPYDEDCTQVSRNRDYLPRMKLEAKAYREQIERMFPPPYDGAGYIRIVSNPHDFGTYLSLRVYYDKNNEEATNWAFTIEANEPANWDEQAREYLEAHGYFAKA